MRYLGSINVAAHSDANNYNATLASLDLGTVTANVDTIIESTLNNGDYEVVFVADAATVVTISVDTSAKIVTVHFKANASTVTNVEAAIAALSDGNAVIQVKTAGTGAHVLQATVDEFSATPLAGGVSFTVPSGFTAIFLESDKDGVQFEIGYGEAFITTAARGALLFDAKAVNGQQGPFGIGRDTTPAIAVHNPTSSASVVRVFGTRGPNA